MIACDHLWICGMGVGPHCKEPVLHEDDKILLILNPWSLISDHRSLFTVYCSLFTFLWPFKPFLGVFCKCIVHYIRFLPWSDPRWYINRYAKIQPVDIIGIYNFGCIGVHSFLCGDAHFSVQKKAISFFYWRRYRFSGRVLCVRRDE